MQAVGNEDNEAALMWSTIAMHNILAKIGDRAKEIEIGIYEGPSDDYWLAAVTRTNADLFNPENRRDEDILELASWCVAWTLSRRIKAHGPS